MGDPGEDSRGKCSHLSIGDNAMGNPSTQKRPPWVSLWEEEGEREREERKQKVNQESHVLLPMGSNSESQSDLGLDPGVLDRVMYLGLMPLLLFLPVIPCVLFSRLRGMVRTAQGHGRMDSQDNSRFLSSLISNPAICWQPSDPILFQEIPGPWTVIYGEEP